MRLAWHQARWFELGIWFIYLAAGFVTTWRSGRVRAGVAAALAAGLTDGVVGWRITAAIYQPMRIVFDHDGAELGFAMEMLLLSVLFGGVGAVAGKLSRRLVPSAPRSFAQRVR